MPYCYPGLVYHKSPIYKSLLGSRGDCRISNEGLKIGDLIYFSDTSSARLANLVVKFGNKVAFKSHLDYQKDIPAVYNTLVHVEIVTDIDIHGKATMASAPGPNSRVRKIGFLEYLQDIERKKLFFDRYIVVRCVNQELAVEAARQMQRYTSVGIPYSQISCLLTLLPRALKATSTANTHSMMCQEIVFNVLHAAVQNLKLQHGSILDYLPKKLKAQVTPGVGLYELLQTGYWGCSNLYNVADIVSTVVISKEGQAHGSRYRCDC